MKKGLRQHISPNHNSGQGNTDRPDEEGIKTRLGSTFCVLTGNTDRPDEEGIKTNTPNRRVHPVLGNTDRPDEEGIKTLT